jgi:hypothetical protein
MKGFYLWHIKSFFQYILSTDLNIVCAKFSTRLEVIYFYMEKGATNTV